MNNNLPLFADYPYRPGYKESDTSEAAADAMTPTAATLREAALNAIAERPRSADQVADVLGESELAIRPRLSELVRQGLIADTGMRALNRSGRKAKIWRAV